MGLSSEGPNSASMMTRSGCGPFAISSELCRDHAKPVFGICFGHQIMADVYGGKAEKAEIGNVVGARGFDYGGSSVDAFVWHQDQVTQVPPSARVTGSADHCPVGALDYDFPARSVQFHPEYRASHLRELFVRGRDVFLAPQEADEGWPRLKWHMCRRIWPPRRRLTCFARPAVGRKT